MIEDKTRKSDVQLKEIDGYSDFLDSKDAWNELLARRTRRSVFFTHEWIDAAWQWRRISESLHVVCCSVEDKIIGIAPLCIGRVWQNLLCLRQLTFVEVPDTQECDFIAGDDDTERVALAVLNDLSLRRDWDVAVLSKLESDSRLLMIAQDRDRPQKLLMKIKELDENLEVDLSGPWDDYYSQRSRRLKKGNNHCRNKIYADGNDVKLHWSSTLSDVECSSGDLLPEMKRISASSWKSKTGLTLENSGPGAFIDRISEHAVANGWLSTWALEVNGSVAATEYQLEYDGVILALRADFDPEYSHLSPGTYLNWQILQRLFETNCTMYRMGAGNNPYKHRWVNHTTQLWEIRAYNRTFRGICACFLEETLRPRIRRILDRIRNVSGKSAESVHGQKD